MSTSTVGRSVGQSECHPGNKIRRPPLGGGERRVRLNASIQLPRKNPSLPPRNGPKLRPWRGGGGFAKILPPSPPCVQGGSGASRRPLGAAWSRLGDVKGTKIQLDCQFSHRTDCILQVIRVKTVRNHKNGYDLLASRMQKCIKTIAKRMVFVHFLSPTKLGSNL